MSVQEKQLKKMLNQLGFFGEELQKNLDALLSIAKGDAGGVNAFATATSIRSLYSSYTELVGNFELVDDKLTIDPVTFKPKKEVIEIDLNYNIIPLIPRFAFLIINEQLTAHLPNLPDIANLRFVEEGEESIDITIKELLDAEDYASGVEDFKRGADYFDGDNIVLTNKNQSSLPLLVKSPLPVLLDSGDGVLLNKDAGGFNPDVAFEIIPNSQKTFLFIGKKSDYANGWGYYIAT